MNHDVPTPQATAAALPALNGVIVRYDEIFLKRSLRAHFLDLLDRNLHSAIRPFGALKIRRPHGRFVVQVHEPKDALPPPPPLPRAHELSLAVSRVFGVSSVSPAYILEPGLDDVMAKVPQLVSAWLQARPAATFGVRVKRVDKRFPLDSVALGRELGARILADHPALGVDLETPALRVGVEIRPESTYVYHERLRGPGGLPSGVSGEVLGLLSGGIDSPVALWAMMSRGLRVQAVYFHSFPYTGDAAKEKVRALATAVGAWQGGMTLHVVPFAAIQRACFENARPRLLVLLYRRFMLRIAEMLARSLGATALVTGESLGQVASQTLPNIDCIQRAVTMPILRPLIANDKKETIARAEALGTYAISIQPADDCCSLFVPRHPELRGRPAELDAVEARLPVAELVAEALAGVERIETAPPLC